jgi:hypothetical protein
MTLTSQFSFTEVRQVLGSVLGPDLHAKRIDSLCDATLGVLLTLLGAAGEALGYDRHLKANTAKHRTHSLFRQGCMLYDLIPTMPESRLLPLMETFTAMLDAQPLFSKVFGAV